MSLTIDAGYVLSVSAEWLALGLIPWSPGVEQAMEPYRQPGSLPVPLEGVKAAPVPAKADFSAQAFSVRSRAGWAMTSSGRYWFTWFPGILFG